MEKKDKPDRGEWRNYEPRIIGMDSGDDDIEFTVEPDDMVFVYVNKKYTVFLTGDDYINLQLRPRSDGIELRLGEFHHVIFDTETTLSVILTGNGVKLSLWSYLLEKEEC